MTSMEELRRVRTSAQKHEGTMGLIRRRMRRRICYSNLNRSPEEKIATPPPPTNLATEKSLLPPETRMRTSGGIPTNHKQPFWVLSRSSQEARTLLVLSLIRTNLTVFSHAPRAAYFQLSAHKPRC